LKEHSRGNCRGNRRGEKFSLKLSKLLTLISNSIRLQNHKTSIRIHRRKLVRSLLCHVRAFPSRRTREREKFRENLMKF
jgi:hypothetical protein